VQQELNKSLTALVPATNLGMTTAEYPLYFYIPNLPHKQWSCWMKTIKRFIKPPLPESHTWDSEISFADLKDLPPLQSRKSNCR